jgi:hypothetical protein
MALDRKHIASLDSLSYDISKALRSKYPDIDTSHYAPNIIKDFIIKTNSSYKNRTEVQTIIHKITTNLNQFRTKLDKNKQSRGIVDFAINNLNDFKKPSPPQQKLVQPTTQPIIAPTSSKREFINKNPLIIDSNMATNNKMDNVYLNNIETSNLHYNNYQSHPANQTLNLLKDLPTNLDQTFNQNNHKSGSTDNNVNLKVNDSSNELDVNHTDRFILTEKQRNLIREEENEWTYYLVIDSKDRDFKSYPNPSSFTIRFSPPNFNSSDARTGFVDKIFHNVKSIELIRCAFLDTSTQQDASDYIDQGPPIVNNSPPYISIEIEEFGTQHNGTNQNLNRTLAIVDTYQKVGNFKYFDIMYDDSGTLHKCNPRITIDKMSIKFKLPDGTLYNFGNANNNNTSTVNYMVFRIIVMQRSLETQFLNKTFG